MAAAAAAAATVEPPTVIDGIKHIYNTRIKPVEELYKFPDFHSPLMLNSDFDAKPMVLLLGQYSVGKTSFIRYLLGRDFPGQRIGPEPTTDRFVAVMGGKVDRVIPGNALAVQADMPFRALQKFGTAFLNKFEAAICPCEILEKVYFVDTPGVLSGEKQRIGRSYDFVEVVEWFAERADMILLLFDAHKLDISDEFKRSIHALKGQDDKVRVVLNKADRVNTQQLMRVYGALMWSLGKVFKTPEVVRVYIGSFWEKPLAIEENRGLFEAEQNDLLMDLRQLPRYAAVRKINELVKRARLCVVHAHIISHLRNEMPAIFGKDKKKKELIANLHKEFLKIHKAKRLPVGDFPNVDRTREALAQWEFEKFPKFNPKLVDAMEKVLAEDIPRLMRQLAAASNAAEPGGGMSTGLEEEKVESAEAYTWTGTPAEAKAKLIQFYTRFNPAKLHAVDAILREYRGRESELFTNLYARYGNPDEEDPYSGSGPTPLHLKTDAAPAGAHSYGGAEAATPSAPAAGAGGGMTPSPLVSGGAGGSGAGGTSDSNPFGDEDPAEPNPFDSDEDEGGASGEPWALEADLESFTAIFNTLPLKDGKVTGGGAKKTLVDSGLPKATLRPLWELADIDKDGMLDRDEFAVAMHLISLCSAGGTLPEELPANVIPPSKRGL